MRTTMPDAVAVAVPELLAPGASLTLTAFSVAPSQELSVRVLSLENAGMLVLPARAVRVR